MDWVWAAAWTAALLPLTIVELLRAARTPDDTAWAAAVIACFVVLHLLVAARRLAPLNTLVAASGVMLVLTAASLPGTPTIAVLLPSSVAYLTFTYTAASSDDRWADVAAVTLGLTGAALITAVSIAHGMSAEAQARLAVEPGPIIALAGFLFASIGAAWALGRYRREFRRKLAAQELGREQAGELRLQAEREAVAQERRRMGRELHDVISHSLAVMVAQAEASRVLLGRDDVRARTAIEHVVETGRAAMADMRGLLTVFTDTSHEGTAGPLREPSPGLRSLLELVERTAGPERRVALVETGEARQVTPGAEVTAYRVVQESLTNTLKHTEPPTQSEVRVVWRADVLEVIVNDDGVWKADVSDATDGRRHTGHARAGGAGGRPTRERCARRGARVADAGDVPIGTRPTARALHGFGSRGMTGPASRIRVAIADDQELIRSAIGVMLEAQADLEVVAEASDGGDLLELARLHRFDVVLMDIRMPRLDGIAATRRLLAERPGTRVLVLTTYDLDEYVFASIRAGASGFLTKDASSDEIVAAIRAVHAGDSVLAPRATTRLVDFVARAPEPVDPETLLGPLTARERDVLMQLVTGASNDVIAERLHLSGNTVKTHVASVLAKLGLPDRVHVVIWAYERGLAGAP